MKAITVRQEGRTVVLVYDGRAIVLPYDAAIEIGRALIAQGRLAEELVNVDRLIGDQAILQRAGLPMGLTNNKDIQREALKEAQWNSTLRKNMPSIASGEVVGTPTLLRGNPPSET